MQEKLTLRPSLRDLMFTMFRFKWVALFSFFGVLCIGILLTILTPKTYEVKSRVFIGADIKQLKLNQQADQSTRFTLAELISTEVELVKSLPVLDAALKQTHASNKSYTMPIDKLMADLVVLPVRNTSLIEVRLESSRPHFAATLLNNIVKIYINRRQMSQTDSYERDHYQGLLNDMNKNITQVETEYAKFIAERDITQIATQQQKELERLVALENARVTKERELLVQKQMVSDLATLRSDFKPERVPTDLAEHDRQIRNLIDEYIRLSQSRNALLTQQQLQSPELNRLSEQIDLLCKSLENQVGIQLDAAQRGQQTGEAELGLLRNEIKAIEAKTREWASATSKHENLLQQLNDLRSVRTVLTRQIEETKIRASEKGSMRIEELAPAVIPTAPSKPNVSFNLTATLVMAILLGISLPIYLQAVSGTLFHDFEVQRATGLPVLCSVRNQSK